MKKYTPLVAEPHTPPYKIHKYFARRPWNVFSQLINLYSEKNDIILDPFMGGGVTILESLKLGRSVIGIDLNPLSKFIVSNMVKSLDNIKSLDLLTKEILHFIEELYSDFDYIEINSIKHKILWNELTYYVICNHCGTKTKLSNSNKISNGKYRCENSKCKSNISSEYIQSKNCTRNGYTYLYAVVSSGSKSKDKIHIEYDRKLAQRLNDHIYKLEKLIKNSGILIPKNKIPINWDRQHEDLLEKKNIKNFEDLFTRRNLYINLLLKNKIDSIESSNLKEILRLVFSSSLRDTNIMSFTNARWQSGSPTTWSKHAYWIPSQFCEVNVLDAFERAYSRMRASLKYNESINLHANEHEGLSTLSDNNNSFVLFSNSISDVKIPDNYVDAIITDPPYGSNVQYLELSHFWYPWNKDIYKIDNIDFNKEAVANRKKNFFGSKNTKDYADNLYTVFSKCYRVLKTGKIMSLTFNNKDMGSWLAIIVSILRSGFEFREMYFQDGVKNYKQTAHTKYKGSPYGDFIYIFVKDVENKNSNKEVPIIKDEFNLIDNINEIFKSDNYVQDDKSKSQIIDMFTKIIPIINKYIKSNGQITEKTYDYFHKRNLENV